MSLIHYLFVGHFEHEGTMVRFSKSPTNPVFRPLVRQPLDKNQIKDIVQEVVPGANGDDSIFPPDWQTWLHEDGFLVCDKYCKNPEEKSFVMRLVERTGCELLDVAAHQSISLKTWSSVDFGSPEPTAPIPPAAIYS